MNIPVEPVASWEIALLPDEQQLVLRPRVAKSEEAEQPSRQFALSLPVARLLRLQLAESIRLLEEQSAQTPEERRKAQERVPKDRRKARPLEGSPPTPTDPQQLPGHAAQDKAEK